MPMKLLIKIRAHHFLCMQGFQGYGYNDAFAAHLHSVIMRLKANPHTIINVVAECDEICNGCPNHVHGKCHKNDNADQCIKRMDLNILERTGIRPDDIIEVSRMIEQVNRTFQNCRQLSDICGDCQWRGKCTWYMALLS